MSLLHILRCKDRKDVDEALAVIQAQADAGVDVTVVSYNWDIPSNETSAKVKYYKLGDSGNPLASRIDDAGLVGLIFEVDSVIIW
jgi:hypothetical protein